MILCYTGGGALGPAQPPGAQCHTELSKTPPGGRAVPGTVARPPAAAAHAPAIRTGPTDYWAAARDPAGHVSVVVLGYAGYSGPGR